MTSALVFPKCWSQKTHSEWATPPHPWSQLQKSSLPHLHSKPHPGTWVPSSQACVTLNRNSVKITHPGCIATVCAMGTRTDLRHLSHTHVVTEKFKWTPFKSETELSRGEVTPFHYINHTLNESFLNIQYIITSTLVKYHHAKHYPYYVIFYSRHIELRYRSKNCFTACAQHLPNLCMEFYLTVSFVSPLY